MGDDTTATTPGRGASWGQLARAPFVSVATFRKSGEPVATPVWIAMLDGNLVLTSELATGKVRRLRANPRVELQICDRFGRIPPGAPLVAGVGVLVTDPAASRRAMSRLRDKYGVQFPLVLGVERLVRRIQRRPAERTIILIEPVSAPPQPSTTPDPNGAEAAARSSCS